MNLLYLAHRIPYPPNKGDKIRSYHHVRYLAQRHSVHLISFYDEPGDEAGAAALEQLCRSVHLVRLDKARALRRGLRALLSGRSLSEGYYDSEGVRCALRRLAAAVRIDVAWAFSSAMAQYLPAVEASFRVADYVDVDSEKWAQFAAHSHPPLRWCYRLEAHRLRSFEKRAAEWADRILFVSPHEASLFRSLCPWASSAAVPNGVDTDFFVPANAEPEPSTILFTGALDYRPNVDAVLFCARSVLPLVRREVPDARLVAVGHRPVAALLREARRQNGALEVVGSVPDIRPYFRRARAYVAPLRLGRGIQNKVLEAMAMRVPVVATRVALEGLEAEPGRDLLQAETPQEFAAAVVSLLRDPLLHRRLTTAATRLIRSRYDWNTNLAGLDACLPTQVQCGDPNRNHSGTEDTGMGTPQVRGQSSW